MTTRAGTRATVGRGRDSHDLIRVHGARENDQHRDPEAPADGVQRRFRLGQDFPVFHSIAAESQRLTRSRSLRSAAR